MSELIGAALRSRRERRQLTLQQVSEATRVRVHYLQALENGDISAMPSAAQARGFLRIYATFLELDLEALIPSPAADASALPATPAAMEAAPIQPTTAEPISPRAETPGLLSSLRERLLRRRGVSPATPEVDAAAPSEPQPQADDKKKDLS